ncbi:putative C2 domain [Monocercomonoides exilis]|uniref:putative C2 domain n=1 Tax=Monocercomonoides exilis TaxID=2049356 RepID=UPI0035596F7C|nr:putative C2 domain [Monocercomonoides exilis]|eukprot:MONOS_9936.1-p1 / transcript=MONOS_9936.1 / gene=MONOS_9936 / organism=Monocercomonoides_exilis_PA203 / gene_product=unspecified product / transcript_product=unspecified product / location=Mono_scaffold00429:15755-16649(-) / protein_length=257 / sequence_SO=supercontig / SO=protein_coding / is_pseudo=false
MYYPGTIRLEIISCKDVPAVDVNGLSDPYVVIKIGKYRRQTKVIKNCLHPKFKEKFTLDFDPKNEKKDLILELWDSNVVTSDQLIGSLKLDILQYLNNKQKENFEFHRKSGKSAGKVKLEILYDCPSVAKPKPTPPAVFGGASTGTENKPVAPAPPPSIVVEEAPTETVVDAFPIEPEKKEVEFAAEPPSSEAQATAPTQYRYPPICSLISFPSPPIPSVYPSLPPYPYICLQALNVQMDNAYPSPPYPSASETKSD